MTYIISTFDEWTPLLVHPSANEFAVFQTEGEAPDGATLVSESVSDLLESAKFYPPALALTKLELQDSCFHSHQELERALSESLNFWLSHQPTHQFPVWKAQTTDASDFVCGAYYWVVGLDTRVLYGELAYWIAGGYEIYPGLLSNFERADELRKLLETRHISTPVQLIFEKRATLG